MMGLSRETFYRYQRAVDDGGVEALLYKSRRVPNIKNRIDTATEQAVLDFAIEYPAYGQLRAGNELRKTGVFVSPSGVRYIWLRHNLECMKARLNALSKKAAEEGFILTESHLAALEKKQDNDLADGEIETAHPGYLGSQDTFYVGTLKGVFYSSCKRLSISLSVSLKTCKNFFFILAVCSSLTTSPSPRKCAESKSIIEKPFSLL